ncbi:Myosin regulatory light polypeptide 9 [Sciurus carolinensis]|uniref:Myosin regulatory light polypeptide 9 n=1 Tax=Sciurus carolinensis TaxID=30640 RepID=A0AA41SUM4_SCICA|nr:Myosin regulatory light polypeptide 9 [Sciurus carolinensis]
MSSKRTKIRTTKKRPQCATSNVFAMFDQSQIQEFKEAFNLTDQNRDGFIDKEDLHDMLPSLGKNPTDDMINKPPGPINFTMFLTMFGEKLNGTDPQDVIRNAFAFFDEEATGTIQEDYLRELLTTMGDQFINEKWMSCTEKLLLTKRGISITSSSHSSLNMEQKTKMTEKNFKFLPNVSCCHFGYF